MKQEEENLTVVENENFEIRKQLNRLIRKPGKNFTELFDTIKTLKGNLEVQVKMVRLVIKESLRFKRQNLAHLLEEHIEAMMNVENK